ncbi:MAG: hypothetical protein R3B90_06435 [Planctomycetaceae bacterium]
MLIALVAIGVAIAGSLVPMGMVFAGPYLGLLCTVTYLRLTDQPLAIDDLE